MGLLNSALQIGRSAILGYQGALHVVGNNISSAGSPDYTRLSPQLDPVTGRLIAGALQPGSGVALTAIQRNIDEALEGRLRLAVGQVASASTQETVLAQVENMFDDLMGTGLGAQLSEFFSAFEELQNTPEEPAIRDLAINRGAMLAEAVRNLRERLAQLSEDIDKQITGLVTVADGFAREIATLNQEIARAEGGRRGQATALRDQRDGLLRNLSEIFDVTVREQPNGTINVYIGSEALIQGASVRGLVAVRDVNGETIRTSVRFAGTNQEVTARGGKLEGLILARDRSTQIAALDELAAAIIVDVNRIHADGQGMVGFKSVTGAYDVLNTDVPLDSNDAGLPFLPDRGSFYITVADDETGTPVAYRIDILADGTDAGTTLESLVEAINDQAAGVSASITSDQRLNITAADGFSFTFGHDGQEVRPDTSGVLAALGINTFFTGTDARNIAVSDVVVSQPSLLSAASVFLDGDGSTAGRIAALDTTVSSRLRNVSIGGFYRTITNSVAMESSKTRNDTEATSSVLSALQAQRENISGVNLDEEAISLVKFQRSFQGAARFITVVDELLAQLVNMIR